MAKTKLSEYSATASSNTDINSINIDEGMSPSNVNNAIRELMAQLKNMESGTDAVTAIKSGNIQITSNTISSTDLNGNINITPNGNGNVVLDGINYPQADGTADYFLKTNGAGQLSFAQVDTASIAADAIDGTKIADDAIGSEHIADNAVGAAALNVTGNGTAGQFLSSDGDGSMTWADAGGGFAYNAPTGTSQTWDIGSYNYFNMGQLSGNTTVAFSSVPTEANWEFKVKGGFTADAGDYTKGVQFKNYSLSSLGGTYYGYGIWFKPDGTKMYTTGYSNGIHEWDLSTAWRPDSGTINATRTTSDGAPWDDLANGTNQLQLKPDGTKIYWSTSNGRLYQSTLSTAWDITTAGSASYVLPAVLAGTSGIARAFWFKSDGSEVYVHNDNNQLDRYTLSTSWDVSTASHNGTYTNSTLGINTAYNMWMNSSGTKAVFGSSSGAQVLTLSTAWNWSTAGSVTTYPYSESGIYEYFYLKADETEAFRASNANLVHTKYGDQTSLTLPTSVNVNGIGTSDNVLNPSPDTEYIYKCITSDGGTNVTRFALGSVNLF